MIDAVRTHRQIQIQTLNGSLAEKSIWWQKERLISSRIKSSPTGFNAFINRIARLARGGRDAVLIRRPSSSVSDFFHLKSSSS